MYCIDEGKGPVLVLIHGFPLTHQMWKAQIEHFKRDYRVIALDIPGFGRSMPTKAKTLPEYADEVDALLTERGVKEPVTLAGFSLGGYIVFPFYFKNPQKIRSLVFSNTRSIADSPEAAKGRETLAKEILSRGSVAAFEAMLPKIFAKSTPTHRPDIIEAVKHMALSCSKEGLATALRAMAVRPDYSPQLGEIKVPTLVITGSEDAISSPEEMKKIANSISKSTFQVVSNSGHMSPMENAIEFNRALEAFLKN